jgi:methyltransferase (TIGR00027 family)
VEDRPSLTALAVCWMRAAEHRRVDPVVSDPYAEGFLPRSWRAGLPLACRLPRGQLHAFVVGRHRFIDDALRDHPTPQTVLLGAGYDSRPWRLPLATRWLEVDHRATLARRQRRAARLPATDRSPAPIDFRHDDLAAVLDAAGHDPEQPTSWVWEGVSMYLGRAEVVATVQALRARSAPGSQLLLDLWHRVDGQRRRDGIRRALPAALELIAEPLRFGLHPDDAPIWLQSHGWVVTDRADARSLREEHGQHLRPDPSMCVVRSIPTVA